MSGNFLLLTFVRGRHPQTEIHIKEVQEDIAFQFAEMTASVYPFSKIYICTSTYPLNGNTDNFFVSLFPHDVLLIDSSGKDAHFILALSIVTVLTQRCNHIERFLLDLSFFRNKSIEVKITFKRRPGNGGRELDAVNANKEKIQPC